MFEQHGMRLYDNRRWRRLKRQQLRMYPLCALCKDKGLTVEADVVHHLVPHMGDLTLFYHGKLQSLCKRCHDGITGQKEKHGYINDIGADGWPIDARHPVYTTR